MVRCSFGPSTQTCLRSRRVVVVCHAEAFSDWRCMAVSFPGSGQQACLSEQKACGGLPRCSRVVLSGMHARFRARLVLAMLHNACAAGGFTATLGSGTSGDTRVGGVSDLTSQDLWWFATLLKGCLERHACKVSSPVGAGYAAQCMCCRRLHSDTGVRHLRRHQGRWRL